jgi:signal transduction histidine kinase
VEATQELAAGNPGRPLPTESMTEIGLLCESFNRMAQTIQTNEAKLLRFNQELEQKVGERTRELEEACVFLKKVQDELMRLERLATIGQIATSVNHEIKTPLNSLSMNLQLLSREKKRCCNGCDIATSRIDEAILLIAQEVARISDILDEFVRYARFAPPVLRPSDLNAIVRNVVDLLSERAEAARVCFRLSLTEGLPSLLLDENKMIQALINLCLNAIQAMPDGGEITMETRAAADGVILIVADTGPGIGPADRERIFQPFFTTKAMGLGFGLPIVQKIVEDHAGRITCQNGTSLGACFELWLPECSVSKEKTQA